MKAKQTYTIWSRSWWRSCGQNMHKEMFWRVRLTTALRTGWACCMAGLILRVGSMHVQWITFPIFGYVMAVTVVGESTAGKAMQDALAVATGTLQGVGMGLVVLQLLPPARCFSNIGLAITCISISAFVITLPKATLTTNVLHKRIALAQTAIIYITAVVQQENMDPVFFPLRLAGTTIVGSTCGMFALLLPSPRLAIFQVRSQIEMSAQISSERLKVLVDAFSASDTALFSAYTLRAKALAGIASCLHSEITSIEDDVGWEAKRFPCLAGSHNLQQLTQGLLLLQKSLVGLELATQADLASSSGHNKQRILLGQIMRDALVYAADWVCLALKYAITDMRQPSPASNAHRQVIIDEGNEVLLSFHEALFNARQQLGYILPTEELQLDKSTINKIGRSTSQVTDESDDENHDHSHMYVYSPHQKDTDHDSNYSCSDSEMVETICNAAREQLEYRIAASDVGREDAFAVLSEIPTNQGLQLLHDCHADTSMINTVQKGSCNGLQLASSLLAGPAKGALLTSLGDQAAAIFFLFNVKRLVQETVHILESSNNKNLAAGARDEHSKVLQVMVMASPSNAQNSQFQPAFQDKRLVSDRNCLDYLPSSGLNPKSALSYENPPRQEIVSSISHNIHPVQKLCRICSADSSLAKSKALNQNKCSRALAGLKVLEPYCEQLRTAFKMSLAMAIGGLLGFWFSNRKGYWADITLALGYAGAAKGGSFKIAVLRSLGTVSGSVYGLIVVLLTLNFPVLRLIALIPWVVFTSFLRKSKIFGYAGAVSAFTGAIVILARTNKDSTDEEFTVIRIVEAFLGMASFIVVEMLVLPKRAASMVKPNISSGLRKLQDFVSSMFELFSDEPCELCQGSKAIHGLKHTEKKLQKTISCQSQLIKEAAEEPQLWFAPFPQKIFSKIMEEQGHIMEMLHFSITVLEDIKRAADIAKVPMDKVLQTPLKEAMSVMEEKVVPALGFLGKVLALEAQELIPVKETRHSSCVQPHKLEANISAPYSTSWGQKLREQTLYDRGLMKTCKNRSVLEGGDVATQEGTYFIQAFEKGALHVACELAALQGSMLRSATSSSCHVGSNASASSPHADHQWFGTDLSNTLSLSLGALAFAMTRLLHHTTQLEKVVHQLLQEENPWTLIDFGGASKSLI